jgi:MFS family permease
MNGEAESVLSLSGRSVLMLAASCGFAVANLYYGQPLLPAMAATFGAGANAQGAIAMLTQLGYACGLLLFGPLGDRLDRRRLIAGLLMANMAALALCAFAQNLPWLLAASVLLGLTAMSAQIIIPAVSGHVDPAQRGQTVGRLLSGLFAGTLLARPSESMVSSAEQSRRLNDKAISFAALAPAALASRSTMCRRLQPTGFITNLSEPNTGLRRISNAAPYSTAYYSGHGKTFPAHDSFRPPR